MFNKIKNGFTRITAPALPELKKYSLLYISGSVIKASSNFAMGFILSMFVKNAFDAIFNETMVLTSVMVFFVIFMVLFFVVSSAEKLLLANFHAKVNAALNARMHKHMLKMPQIFFDTCNTSEVTTHWLNDVSKYLNLFRNDLIELFSQFAVIIGSFIVIFIWEWRLALVYFIIAALSFTTSFFLLRYVKIHTERERSGYTDANQKLLDILNGMMEIRMFGLEMPFIKKYREKTDEEKQANIGKIRSNALLKGLNALYMTLCFGAIIGVGFYLINAGITTIGTVLGVATFVAGFIWVYRAVIMTFSDIQSAMVACDGLASFFALPTEDDLKDSYNTANTGANRSFPDNLLSIENIFFGYTGENKNVLENISINIEKRSIVGLVGESGSGKSTMLKIISGLYLPREGWMNYGKTYFEQATLSEWRENFAYVPQNPVMYNGSVYYNISIANPSATTEEVYQAAKAAHADEFIRSLPNGYDTILGPDGQELSGGELQRVAIARVLLKGAPVLLLDEPTSALDSESESMLLQTITDIAKSRLIILASHRYSTIKICDYAFELKAALQTKSFERYIR
jgi:ATP-binding cassette subfamily B protein